MVINSQKLLICYLCGEPIDTRSQSKDLRLSKDHIPPRRYFPKQIRKEVNPNLWVTPAHQKCNHDYCKDEEYFYAGLLPKILEANPNMAKIILDEFKNAPEQNRSIISKITKTCSQITPGGIYLPNGVIRYDLDEYRIQRIVLKIARGLYFLEYHKFIPLNHAVDIHMCLSESEVPETYRLLWRISKRREILTEVFSFKHYLISGYYWYSLLFWKSVMFCTAFKSTKNEEK